MDLDIQRGNDMAWYAVFADEEAADQASQHFPTCNMACFHGYFNAIQLTPSSVDRAPVTNSPTKEG